MEKAIDRSRGHRTTAVAAAAIGGWKVARRAGRGGCLVVVATRDILLGKELNPNRLAHLEAVVGQVDHAPVLLRRARRGDDNGM